MRIETDSNDLAAKFLLGKLSADVQEAVEEEYFHNTSSFENILIAENSLMDDYVSDRLSPEDRVLFENRLLINPRQWQRAAFAQTLVRYAARLPVEDLGPSTSESKWSAVFGQFFSVQPLLSYSFAAAVILLLAGAVIWWSSNDSRRPIDENLAETRPPANLEINDPVRNSQTDENKPVKDNIASLKDTTPNAERTPGLGQASPKKELARQDKSPTILSTIILPLGSTRGAEGAKAFVIPKKTSVVNLQLRFESGHFTSYFVVVETADGQQVWRGKVPKPTESNNEKTVKLTVPARLLQRGDYIITLKGLTKEGTYESVADYFFTINRP